MKTILVFDCWLPGFTYINELAEEPGISVVFVHASSLQLGTPAREYRAFKEQYAAPEWVHDFSEFGYDFDTLFARTKPDALLVLSLHHLEARTALSFASRRKIPTYFIPHGIFLLGDGRIATGKRSGLLAKAMKAVSKLPRVIYYSKFFWKFHIQMVNRGLHDARLAQAVRSYFELLTKYFYWQWYPSPLVQDYYGASLNNMILYDSSIAEYYLKHYENMVSGANIISSGTLDMTRIKRQVRNDPGILSAGTAQRYAYLISSPDPEDFVGDGRAIYAEVVRKLRILVQESGCEGLMYRPHPGEPAEFTKEICSIAGVEFDPRRDLANLVNAEIVCGTSSSLLYCAILLHRPIVIWNSKRLTLTPPYYEPLISYPTIPFDADLDCDEAALAALRTRREAVADPDLSDLGDPIADLVRLVSGASDRHG